jgi:hypothetical protein
MVACDGCETAAFFRRRPFERKSGFPADTDTGADLAITHIFPGALRAP